jgi:hypothetical protein
MADINKVAARIVEYAGAAKKDLCVDVDIYLRKPWPRPMLQSGQLRQLRMLKSGYLPSRSHLLE